MPRASVGKVADLPQGKLVGADIDGEKILVANVGGSFHAMRSTCNHAGGPLHQGKLEGKIVTCPWHGSQWDVTNGNLVWFQRPIGPSLSLRALRFAGLHFGTRGRE